MDTQEELTSGHLKALKATQERRSTVRRRHGLGTGLREGRREQKDLEEIEREGESLTIQLRAAHIPQRDGQNGRCCYEIK